MVHRPWSHHEYESGRSSVFIVSCGSGEIVWLPRQTTPSASVSMRESTSEGRAKASSTTGAARARAETEKESMLAMFCTRKRSGGSIWSVAGSGLKADAGGAEHGTHKEVADVVVVPSYRGRLSYFSRAKPHTSHPAPQRFPPPSKSKARDNFGGGRLYPEMASASSDTDPMSPTSPTSPEEAVTPPRTVTRTVTGLRDRLAHATEDHSIFSFSRLSEDIGITVCLDRSGKAARAVGTASAMTTDKQMVKSYRGLLKTVGNSTRKMVVDPSMPYSLEKSVTAGYDVIWPEIEKEMCDRFILNNGFSFGAYRKQVGEHEPDEPATLYARVVGTLLHATQPYDLSFFGRLRNPLYFAIFLLSVFPLYGVDSLFVITLWLCTNKFDEDQVGAPHPSACPSPQAASIAGRRRLHPSASRLSTRRPQPLASHLYAHGGSNPSLAPQKNKSPLAPTLVRPARQFRHSFQEPPVHHHRPHLRGDRLHQALHVCNRRGARRRPLAVLPGLERPRRPRDVSLRGRPHLYAHGAGVDHLRVH